MVLVYRGPIIYHFCKTLLCCLGLLWAISGAYIVVNSGALICINAAYRGAAVVQVDGAVETELVVGEVLDQRVPPTQHALITEHNTVQLG